MKDENQIQVSNVSSYGKWPIQRWHEIIKLLHNKEAVNGVARQPAEWDTMLPALYLAGD